LNLLSELSDIKLFFIRYSVNFILLIEIIYLPYVLEPSAFSSLELVKNLLLFSPVMLLGINSGYINLCYRSDHNYRFNLFVSSLFVSIFSGFLLYYVTTDLLLSLAVLMYLFAAGIEKILIVDGLLVLASLLKAMYSIILIMFVFFFSNSYSFDVKAYYLLSVIIGTTFWMLFLIKPYARKITTLSISNISLINLIRTHFIFVKEGFNIAFQSIVLVGFFLFDRWFIGKYYPNFLNEYSISFSFAQIVFIALNTIAFSMQKSLGEKMGRHKKSLITRLLKINLYFFLFLILISSVIVYFTTKINFFEGYGSFFISYLIISVLYGSYYLLSSYSVIGLYSGAATLFLIYMVVAIILDVMFSYLMSYLSIEYYYLLIKSGIILLLLSVATHMKVLKYVNDK